MKKKINKKLLAISSFVLAASSISIIAAACSKAKEPTQPIVNNNQQENVEIVGVSTINNKIVLSLSNPINSNNENTIKTNGLQLIVSKGENQQTTYSFSSNSINFVDASTIYLSSLNNDLTIEKDSQIKLNLSYSSNSFVLDKQIAISGFKNNPLINEIDVAPSGDVINQTLEQKFENFKQKITKARKLPKIKYNSSFKINPGIFIKPREEDKNDADVMEFFKNYNESLQENGKPINELQQNEIPANKILRISAFWTSLEQASNGALSFGRQFNLGNFIESTRVVDETTSPGYSDGAFFNGISIEDYRRSKLIEFDNQKGQIRYLGEFSRKDYAESDFKRLILSFKLAGFKPSNTFIANLGTSLKDIWNSQESFKNFKFQIQDKNNPQNIIQKVIEVQRNQQGNFSISADFNELAVGVYLINSVEDENDPTKKFEYNKEGTSQLEFEIFAEQYTGDPLFGIVQAFRPTQTKDFTIDGRVVKVPVLDDPIENFNLDLLDEYFIPFFIDENSNHDYEIRYDVVSTDLSQKTIDIQAVAKNLTTNKEYKDFPLKLVFKEWNEIQEGTELYDKHTKVVLKEFVDAKQSDLYDSLIKIKTKELLDEKGFDNITVDDLILNDETKKGFFDILFEDFDFETNDFRYELSKDNQTRDISLKVYAKQRYYHGVLIQSDETNILIGNFKIDYFK